MAPLNTSVPKACRRQDDARVQVTAHAMGQPNAGAVLWVAIAFTASCPGVGAPGKVDDNVTLTLRSQRTRIPALRCGIVGACLRR